MSHRRRAGSGQDNAPRSDNTTVSRKPLPMLSNTRTETAYPHRNPVVTAKAPSASSPPPLLLETRQSHHRTSALPRSTSGNSTSRLDAIASSRQTTTAGLTSRISGHRRSPSEDVPLIFDSTARTHQSSQPDPPHQMSRKPLSALDSESDTVLGIVVPEKGERGQAKPTILPPQLIPELQALANYSTRSKQPAPSVSTISSPSTRLTESPAPWSASTATTTPISWPSTSPGIVQGSSSNVPSKRFHTVPQPTPTRTRLPKLPQTKEHLKASSLPTPSSTHTQNVEEKRVRRKKGTILDSPAPSPPPRTSSSQRRAKHGDGVRATGSIDETLARAGKSATPPPPTNPSPYADQAKQNVETTGVPVPADGPGVAHHSLQESLQRPPTRPTRDGTMDLGDSRPSIKNEHKAGFSTQHRQLLASALDNAGPESQRREARAPAVPENAPARVQRSPSRLAKLSKLGIFGRRTNTPIDPEKSPKKLSRRGPAAGTGHEGYGKYAPKTRKVSTETNSASSDSDQSVASVRRLPASRRKESTSSRGPRRGSQSDLDDFAASRLKPVVIRGGSRTSVDSEKDSITSQNQDETAYASPSRAISPATSQGTQPRLRSPLKDVSNVRGLATSSSGQTSPLALRRSEKFGTSPESSRMPTPIRTDGTAPQPLISSYDTTQSSVAPSSLAPSYLTSDHSSKGAPSKIPYEKKTRRRWWNPFKSRQQAEASEPVKVSQPARPEVVVSFRTGPAPRSVPYYAVMESDSENNGPEPIGDLFSQVVESRSQTPPPEPEHGDRPPILHNTDSVLLPAAPVWIEPESQNQISDEPEQLHVPPPSTKQPRLAQVGRIPRVVPRNEREHAPRSEREHKPSRRSFSQPFNKQSRQFDHLPYIDLEEEPRQARPLLEIHTDVLPSRPFPQYENLSAKPASAPARTNLPPPQPVNTEYPDLVNFPSRHESDVSATSSSEGKVSVMGPPLIPNQTQREVLRQYPAVRQISMLHADDEIWKEYDDFIDHVMSPSKSPTRKPNGNPQLTIQTQPDLTPEPLSAAAMWKNRTLIPEPRRAVLDLSLPTSLTPPVIFPSPSLLSDKSIGEEIRLRRSRIVSALHSSVDPSSPFSMREFLKDYGPVARDSMGVSERLSTSTAGNGAQHTPVLSSFPDPMAEAEHNHQESAMLIDVVQREKDPAKQSEMHYASLEVARWLSFGRVLFSPAHKEIHTLPERRVLVIDGLGNEDWAIYCAVTYESEKAIIFDMKEASHPRTTIGDEANLPPNYRRKEITSLSERFPFHSAFFSAVVLRFPPAMAETTMKNIITECRRILVPGGHLEIMLLDLDIVNMGVQTRRAVRELKMRITTKSPNVSLKPAIDNMQTLLGGRGFAGLNRCVVGVPVAGRPNGSIDSSSSSRSSRGSYAKRVSGDTAMTQRSSGKVSHGASHNFSLNDLVADHSENADAKIGRMVSRTARSWWQHCFEASVLPNGDLSGSIFSDKKVLSECKSRASSFKLLIAYAQRPVFETRRRTMSEPNANLPATAGAQRHNKASA